MCGRFNIGDSELIKTLLEELKVDPINMPPRYNIAPTDPVPVVIEEQGRRQLHEMRWWLTPSWSNKITSKYSMFNARCENLNVSRAFKGPFRHHRGIIPATSFIEWQAGQQKKQPYRVQLQNKALALACIYDVWEHDASYLESCAIITRESPEAFQYLHNRFPVILSEEEQNLWLDTSTHLDDVSTIFTSPHHGVYEVSMLDDVINNPRYQKPVGS